MTEDKIENTLLELERGGKDVEESDELAHRYVSVVQSWVEQQRVLSRQLLPYDPIEVEELRERFIALASRWKTEREGGSSVLKMVCHPAYQQIIGMGKSAVPLILEELERETDFWFWALQSIMGWLNPVPKSSMGNLSEMRDAWLKWGYTSRYYRRTGGFDLLPEHEAGGVQQNQ
jgi:hypothetical protein